MGIKSDIRSVRGDSEGVTKNRLPRTSGEGRAVWTGVGQQGVLPRGPEGTQMKGTVSEKSCLDRDRGVQKA